MITCIKKHTNFNTIIVTLESTSVYNIHIVNFLSFYELLISYKTYVYYLNPNMSANYRKTYISMDKPNHMNAFLISDFAIHLLDISSNIQFQMYFLYNNPIVQTKYLLDFLFP